MTQPGTTMAQIARELSAAPDLEHTVAQVVEFARHEVGADHAGVTLIRSGGFETVGATSELIELADQAQYDTRQGPCVDAALNSRTQWSGSLATDSRWPRWGPQAAAMGLGSVLSTDLYAGGKRVGALNLYGKANAQFDSDDADVASDLAQHAAVALAAARHIDDLTVALASRTVIGQAQGVLMERHALDAQRAFEVLRRYSQHGNIKLRTVADEVVASVQARRRARSSNSGAPS